MSNGPFSSNLLLSAGQGVQIVPDGGDPGVHDALVTMARAASNNATPFHVTESSKCATIDAGGPIVICPTVDDPTKLCIRHPPYTSPLPPAMTVFAAANTTSPPYDTDQAAKDAMVAAANGTERGYWLLKRDDGKWVTIEVPIMPA